MKNVDAIAASGLVTSGVTAALIQMLVIKGSLSPTEALEIYDNALLILERQQSDAAPEMAPVYRAARSVIEKML